MKIFLIRHAEGENVETCWQSPETPLSDRGRRQAEAVARINRFTNIDTVYSSPLKRTIETAKVITTKEFEIRDELSERIQSPIIYNLERNNSISIDYQLELVKNTDNWNWQWDKDEESKNHVLARAINFKNHVMSNCLGKNILAVTHENFLRVFITQCIMLEDSNDLGFRRLYKSIGISNTGISLLIYNEDQKVWKIGYLNDFSHGI
jgi:probable phosphoglycerate mutase